MERTKKNKWKLILIICCLVSNISIQVFAEDNSSLFDKDLEYFNKNRNVFKDNEKLYEYLNILYDHLHNKYKVESKEYNNNNTKEILKFSDKYRIEIRLGPLDLKSFHRFYINNIYTVYKDSVQTFTLYAIIPSSYPNNSPDPDLVLTTNLENGDELEFWYYSKGNTKYEIIQKIKYH